MQQPPDMETIVAVVVALIVKIRATRSLRPLQTATTVLVSIGAAWAFAEWVADLWAMPVPVAAAVVTLIGEGAARLVIRAVDDPEWLICMFKKWKG